MQNTKSLLWKPKLFLFLISLWLFGFLLAFFFGLGWFFLIESLRRILTYIPPIDRMMRKIFVGKVNEDQIGSEKADSNKTSVYISRILGALITLIWIALTIIVFMKVNIPIIDIFKPLFR
jgi:hypothetical protein